MNHEDLFFAVFSEQILHLSYVRFSGSVEGGLLLSVFSENHYCSQKQGSELWGKLNFSKVEKHYCIKRVIICKLCKKWAKLGIIHIKEPVTAESEQIEYLFMPDRFKTLLIEFLQSEQVKGAES